MDIPLKVLEAGLYCSSGDFYIDAWQAVPICIITHAHSDHVCVGHGLYIGTEESLKIIQHRFGKAIPARALKYGDKIKIRNTWVSLHPAGHILGAAQIRIEDKKYVTVISGDYKRAVDVTCSPFEVIECDIFVTESTFGLPIYQWPSNETVTDQILEWWKENASEKRPSVLFCYALGKAQRLLALLTTLPNQNIYLHGAIASITQLYSQMSIPMLPYSQINSSSKGVSFEGDLILAPPSAMKSPWMKRFPLARTALASGWMEIRGTRRRKGLDKGFVLSDHADWKGLIQTIEETKAHTVLTMHGDSAILARYLREVKKLDARELKGLEMFFENSED